MINGSSGNTTGSSQLKSLLDFLSNFGFDEKYLGKTEIVQFRNFIKSGDFTNEKIWIAQTSSQKINDMIKQLDKIISRILKDSGKSSELTFRKVIDKILSLSYTNDAAGNIIGNSPKDDIQNIINSVLETVTSDNDQVTYKFFGTEFKSTYMQNLVIGKNIFQIIERYKNDNKANLSKESLDKLNSIDSAATYDPELITRIGINNGYFNLKYFLKGLSSKNMLQETAEELLSSKLEQKVNIEIPSGNSFLNFMSNPSKMAEIGFLLSGTLLTIIGVLITTISIKTKITINNRRKILTTRFVFIVIAVVGISLLTLGIMAPSSAGLLAIMAG